MKAVCSKKEINKIIKLREKGLVYKDIASIIGKSSGVVAYWIKKFSIKIKI